MKYEQIKGLEDEKFGRGTEVKRSTFDNMIFREDRLLMALEYIREYGTYFHISQSDGVSERAAYDTIKWIEDPLINHPDFAGPGKKALLKSDRDNEVILIDGTETPIEHHPKKKVHAQETH